MLGVVGQQRSGGVSTVGAVAEGMYGCAGTSTSRCRWISSILSPDAVNGDEEGKKVV